MYNEEAYLQLSGLQHFAFCRRQWALIHIENQWAENYRTADGQIMHEMVHDPSFEESRGDMLKKRAVPVFSASLGVSGECDLLEFRKSPCGVSLSGYEGLWQPFPIEYKRGRPRETEDNDLQLCGQAMCLEGMLCCTIPCGAVYYGETHHRNQVEFTDALREKVKDSLKEMHELYTRGYTPKVKSNKGCGQCSLKDLCLPKLQKSPTVGQYIKEAIEE
ncbi:MAG: CRISPR-associated protein Cas4 [Eubacteriales bacterium]